MKEIMNGETNRKKSRMKEIMNGETERKAE